MTNQKVKVAIIDDHIILRKGIAALVNSFQSLKYSYEVIVDQSNGKELMATLSATPTDKQPYIILLDLNMPEMDGFATINALRKTYPNLKILILSILDDDLSLIRSLRLGAHGYLNKVIDPDELKTALESIMEKGYYYTEMVATTLAHNLANSTDNVADNNTAFSISLNERELDFVRLVCTEMTYSEIARTMKLSARTIDGYRDILFAKLGLTSRVGLALWAVKNGVVTI